MLKKKDLVKQFELVVKQEIIEHNKAISASNLAVNKLNDKIEGFNKTCEFQVHSLKTHNESFKKEVEIFIEDYKKVSNEFSNLKNDQFILNERNHKEIEIIDQAVETVGKKQELLDKRLGFLEGLVIFIKQELKETKISLATYLDKTKLDLIKLIKKQKEEILNRPSEAEAVKKEFMKELSMHKIDNAGLLKEIKVLKKTAFINEKKIENLYTLIDRSNKKINVTS